MGADVDRLLCAAGVHHRRLDRLGDRPGCRLAGDEPQLRAAGGLADRRRARPPRPRPMAHAPGRPAGSELRDQPLRPTDEGLPRSIGRKRNLRPPARTIRLLERRRPDRRARPAGRRLAWRPPRRPRRQRRARLPAGWNSRRRIDARLLARLAAGGRRRPRLLADPRSTAAPFGDCADRWHRLRRPARRLGLRPERPQRRPH